jgi:hypothetical protein
MNFINTSHSSRTGAITFSTHSGSALNEAMRIDSSGNVGIGGSPSNPLTVLGSAGTIASFTNGADADLLIKADSAVTTLTPTTGTLAFGTSSTERMRIDSGGNVGIGNNAPAGYGKFVIQGTGNLLNLNATSGVAYQAFYENGTGRFYLGTLNGSDGLAFIDADGSTERMRIDASGNVGIGTQSPAYLLQLSATDDTDISIISGKDAGDFGSIVFGDTDYPAEGRITYQNSDDAMRFWANRSQAMMINSSGNLLIGKSADDATTDGIQARGVGSISIARSSVAGDALLILNKKTNDGTIAEFRKDGTTVGSIGTLSSNSFIGTGDTGILFAASVDAVLPHDTSSNAARDDAIDLGYSSGVTLRRFKDLYLSGGAYLGGTGAANYLDDYEEGTFTPGFSGASVSSANTNGYYRKIGSLVFISYYTGAATFSSASGDAQLTGLPFTTAGSTQLYPVASLAHYNAFSTTPVDGYLPLNNTYIAFIRTGTLSGATYVNGTKYFMVSACYIAA